jgi:CO/xanthine dehydrogenase Mo-binding subunit
MIVARHKVTDDGGVFLNSAAIANSIHHDTGRRLRDLPIWI